MLHLEPLVHFTIQERDTPGEFRCFIKCRFELSLLLLATCCPSDGDESYSSFHIQSTLVPFSITFLLCMYIYFIYIYKFIYFPVHFSLYRIFDKKGQACDLQIWDLPRGTGENPYLPCAKPHPKPNSILNLLLPGRMLIRQT